MKKIVVVEDNVLNLKLFSDVLKANGFEVIGTPDGQKAYNLIVEENPDLVLMDIQLEGISGIDIIKEIKLEENLKHIPVIAITAFASSYDEQKIRDSGCNDYLAKPFSITDLTKKIKSILEIA